MIGYYALAPDRIARDPIAGGIEITGEQYQHALEALCDPDDKRVIVISDGVFTLAEPSVPEPEPQPEPAPTQDDYTFAIQAVVDQSARAKNYTDGVSLASYDASTVPVWATEAATFIAWRDAVWTYAYAEMAKVLGGQRQQPTVAELLSELPQIQWPA